MYRHLLHIWIVVGFFVLNLEKAFSQVTFNTPTNSLLFTGQTLNLPVRAHHFDNIISAQFVVAWDPSVLKLIDVFDINLPDCDTSKNFGFTDVPLGFLRFVWYKDVPGGTTRADLEHLFKLKFKVVGATSTGTFVSIGELPPITVFEVTKETGAPQLFNAVPQENGFQAVGYVVATTEPLLQAEKARAFFDIFPNPFSEKLTIRPRSADFSGECRLEIRDLAGRLVFEKTEKNLQPSAGTDIAKSQFENTGIYFLTVRTERGFFVEKVCFVEL